MAIIGVVPVKANSSRIKDKNFCALGDDIPLFLRAYRKLSSIGLIDRVFIDTDDPDKLKRYSKAIPDHSILKRPKELALSSATGHDILKWVSDQVECDILVQLLCTAPFISQASIISGIMKVLQGQETCFAGRKVKQYSWKSSGEPIYDYKKLPNSQDLEYTIIETMGLYVVKRSYIQKTGMRTKKNSGIIYVSELEAFDINYPEDLDAAKLINSSLLIRGSV